MRIKVRSKEERSELLGGKTYIQRHEILTQQLQVTLCPICNTWQKMKLSSKIIRYCPKCKANGVNTPIHLELFN